MQDFSFLHMADLHLGSPFRGLSVDDPHAARQFAQAIRDAFTALVDRAVEARVDFVVIAGDVYDREWKDAAVGLFFNLEMAKLARAGIPAFIVKGNHDAASVVTRAVTLPAGVHTFGVTRATTLEVPGLPVVLHGQSYRDREAPDNLARGYPSAVPGRFNIGVLHTSMTGHEGHDPYAPCTEADLVALGYDYWALGHIHVPQMVRAAAPPIVYPGCIQGRSVRECGPRGAMLVRVRDGVPELEPWVADRVRWCVAEVDCAAIDDFAQVPAVVEQAVGEATAAAGERPVALRVVLGGATALHDRMHAHRDEVDLEVAAAAQRARADVWLEKCVLATRPPAAAPGLVPDLAAADGLDPLTALDAVRDDPASADTVKEDITRLLAKLPPGDHHLPDAAAVLAEARALLGARLGERAGGRDA